MGQGWQQVIGTSLWMRGQGWDIANEDATTNNSTNCEAMAHNLIGEKQVELLLPGVGANSVGSYQALTTQGCVLSTVCHLGSVGWPYAITKRDIGRLQSILRLYEGMHNFQVLGG